MCRSTPIAVFARAPVAGAVKTRLIPRLGAEGALDLHRQLVESTLFRARDAALGEVTLWIADDAGHPEVQACVKRQRVKLAVQQGANLGARMDTALAATLAAQPDRGCLLIGTDCPALSSRHLQRAAQLLATHDVVLGPAHDGGYVLIGLNAPQPALFEGIAWGTEAVLAATRARIDAANLRCAELDPLPDLDSAADYDDALTAGWICA
jgi:rSAM/selenodomain-associated transferase 1